MTKSNYFLVKNFVKSKNSIHNTIPLLAFATFYRVERIHFDFQETILTLCDIYLYLPIFIFSLNIIFSRNATARSSAVYIYGIAIFIRLNARFCDERFQ